MVLVDRRIDRILVIKLRAIGDVLLSTVVLKSLRDAFPQSAIDFLTENASREVLAGNPWVNSIVSYNSTAMGSLSLVAEVRRGRYDLVIDLFGNPRSAVVTYASGARWRVGYRFGWRQYCYNIVVEPRGGEVHNTEFNLDALRAIGVPVTESAAYFPVDEGSKRFAGEFFAEKKLTDAFVVALNPGGGWRAKRWGIRQLAEFADLIVNRHGARVVIVWGPGEREGAEQVRSLMKSAADLIPPANLKQLGAILRLTSVLVTNDSGPMHIAATLGTPVVAIFGPTRPQLQGPVGSDAEVIQNRKLLCLGCNFTECPIGNPCMTELSAEHVYEGFCRLLTKIGVPAQGS